MDRDERTLEQLLRQRRQPRITVPASQTPAQQHFVSHEQILTDPAFMDMTIFKPNLPPRPLHTNQLNIFNRLRYYLMSSRS